MGPFGSRNVSVAENTSGNVAVSITHIEGVWDWGGGWGGLTSYT